MNKFKTVLSLIFILPLFGIGQNAGIIPQPLMVVMKKGAFNITAKTPIIADDTNQGNASFLQKILKDKFQRYLPVKGKGDKGIILGTNPQLIASLGEEGYTLNVGDKSISIMAGTTTGVFYGIQSLQQLMDTDHSTGRNIVVSGIEIEDRPRFAWRAFMLDEGRYFKGTEQVKSFWIRCHF